MIANKMWKTSFNNPFFGLGLFKPIKIIKKRFRKKKKKKKKKESSTGIAISSLN